MSRRRHDLRPEQREQRKANRKRLIEQALANQSAARAGEIDLDEDRRAELAELAELDLYHRAGEWFFGVD